MMPRPLALILALGLAGAAAAQDVAIAPVQWLDPDDAPDELPRFRQLEPPKTPPQLRDVNETHYVESHVQVAADGTTSYVERAASSAWLEAVIEPFGKARAGTRSGRAVPSEVVVHTIFNPADAPAKGDRARPRLTGIRPPVYPELDLNESPQELRVNVTAEVDENGRVFDVRPDAGADAKFALAAAAAVRRWTFEPAQKDGQAVPGTLTVPVLFIPPASVQAVDGLTPPKLLRPVRPTYPLAMRMAGLEGEVTVAFIVTVEGRIRNAYTVRSTHPGFDEAAILAVEQWSFEPGSVNGRLVNSRMRVPIHFSISGGGSTGFTVTRPAKFADDMPEHLRFDVPPEISHYGVPVYPREALLDGREGEVVVGFVVGPDGHVHAARALGEGDPDLQGAAVAAVESYVFRPPSRAGKPCFASVRIRLRFRRDGSGEAPVSDETRRLLRLVKKSPERLVKLSDLDGIPEARSRRPPVVPLVADKFSHGEAQVEFILDRKGFARLPRVLRATHPDFGYAAVQAVSTWRFEPPRRDGRAVDAVVQIPVQFNLRPPAP